MAAAALAVLGVLTALVLSVHRAPFAVDEGLHHWALVHRTRATQHVADVITDTGTGVFPYAVAAAAGAIGCRRRFIGALAAMAVLGLGQLVRIGVRIAVDRPRPPAADWAFQASDASFPSGHATTSALAAGLLAWAVLRVAPRIAGRVAAACCGLWAVTVAATRVFLGVHWPSDIVAGWLLATAWLAVTLPALSWWAGRKPVRARGPRTD